MKHQIHHMISFFPIFILQDMSDQLGKLQDNSFFSIVPAVRLSDLARGLMLLAYVVDENAKVLVLTFLQKQSKLSRFMFHI